MYTIDAYGGVLWGAQDADFSDKSELVKVIHRMHIPMLDEDLLYALFLEWKFITRDDMLGEVEGEAWMTRRILSIFHQQWIADHETDEETIMVMFWAFFLIRKNGKHAITALETSCTKIKMSIDKLFGKYPTDN